MKRTLTLGLRHELAKPFGKLATEEEAMARAEKRKGLLISVGDHCSALLIRAGETPDIVVFDNVIRRMPASPEITKVILEYAGAGSGEIVRVRNPAGTITDETESAVKKAIRNRKGKIEIEGEEDLAALIAIIFSSDGDLIIYGQPNEGMVLVESNEKVRTKAKEFYERMTVQE
ncbi:Uncharacterised protein [Candidatus Gugararchaeum adminiculabundum]|nr:Uncharacterised protein [Candidatus Gugararchaeum adminiculabundum]